MNVITDAKQINLSSGSADIYYNQLNSSMRFNIPYLIRKDKTNLYNTIRVLHAEIPYSFYIINEYNNTLVMSTGTITMPYGNYNANTFMRMIQPLMPTGMSITFDTSNGIFTISYNQAFTIYNTSTCKTILGFKSTLLSSSGNTIIFPFPGNFLGTKNLYVKTPNIILENYNTITKDYITLFSIPVNVPPFGIIIYDNTSGSKNYIKNSTSMDYLEVIITDDYNNPVDFNNIDWTISLEVEATIQVPQVQKSINELLNDFYTAESAQPQTNPPDDPN
jgi:hypothetical protein